MSLTICPACRAECKSGDLGDGVFISSCCGAPFDPVERGDKPVTCHTCQQPTIECSGRSACCGTWLDPKKFENFSDPVPTGNKSSIFRGVCWNRKQKSWVATVRVGNQVFYIGCSKREADAAELYDNCVAHLRDRGLLKRKLKLNFPEHYPEGAVIRRPNFRTVEVLKKVLT